MSGERTKRNSEITINVNLTPDQIHSALMEYCHNRELLPEEGSWVGSSCKFEVTDSVKAAYLTFVIRERTVPDDHEHPTVLNNEIPEEEEPIPLCNLCSGRGFLYAGGDVTVDCPACREFR